MTMLSLFKYMVTSEINTIDFACLLAEAMKSTHSRMPNDEIFLTPLWSWFCFLLVMLFAIFLLSFDSSIMPTNFRHVIGPSANFSIVSLDSGATGGCEIRDCDERGAASIKYYSRSVVTLPACVARAGSYRARTARSLPCCVRAPRRRTAPTWSCDTPSCRDRHHRAIDPVRRRRARARARRRRDGARAGRTDRVPEGRGSSRHRRAGRSAARDRAGERRPCDRQHTTHIPLNPQAHRRSHSSKARGRARRTCRRSGDG